MSHRDDSSLPAWFWFFPAFLLALIAALLWQRNKLPGFSRQALRRPALRRTLAGGPRYVEPDSIPIDLRFDQEEAAAPTGLEVAEWLPEPETEGAGEPAELEVAEWLPESEAGEDVEPVEMEISDWPAESSRAQALFETGAQESGQPDDIKIIEGIGPAIASLLADHGIDTFRKLADTPVERLDEILTEANLRRLADPATWPEQARLAAAGDWEGLERLQESLKGGRRV